MENTYLNLFAFLLDSGKRKQLHSLLDTIHFGYPFGILYDELKKEKDNLTKKDFLVIVKDLLSSDEYLFFKDMPDKVSNLIGHRAVRTICATHKLNEIGTILQSDDSVDKKLEQISGVSNIGSTYGQTKSKLFSEMEMKEVPDLFYLFHYGLTKEELAVICAFTGRGKTSIMLAFVRDACLNQLKTLYISIKDFSETMLKKRLLSVNEFPDFYACCYSELTIPELEIEIDNIQPDVVFLDYLGVVSGIKKVEQRRHELENITADLKKMAQDKNVIMITAHQLNKDEPFPKADDLLEAKAGIISHADLVLGIGGDINSDYRNVTTIKSRRHSPLKEFLIKFSFNDLTYDYETYEQEGGK